jgi:hypothetical protein
MLEPKFFNLFNLIAKENVEGIDRLTTSGDFDFHAF